DKVNFKEGDLVKKGDILFEIDARVYQAAFDQSKAKLALSEAQLRYKEAQYRRIKRLAESQATSREELDQSIADRDVAAATVESDRADLARRQLDLDFTKVRAPVAGRVSRALVTPGNLIRSGEQNGGTLLTTIMSIDPIYIYFDVDEQTVLH